MLIIVDEHKRKKQMEEIEKLNKDMLWSLIEQSFNSRGALLSSVSVSLI